MKPYWSDGTVHLYLGDCREVLPEIDVTADCIVADPPYESTSLRWDRWPDGWLETAAAASRSMWCFLPLRQFAEPPYRGREFRGAGWYLSQDVEADHAVWEKHNGSSFHADRFKRVHEIACHWYRGDWASLYHEVPTTADATARAVRRKQRPPHTGHIEASSYTSEDGGPRLMRSVFHVRSMHGRAIHESEKPVGLLDPLIRYSAPPPRPCPGSVRGKRIDTRRRAVCGQARHWRRDQRAVLRGGGEAAEPDDFGGVVTTKGRE